MILPIYYKELIIIFLLIFPSTFMILDINNIIDDMIKNLEPKLKMPDNKTQQQFTVCTLSYNLMEQWLPPNEYICHKV